MDIREYQELAVRTAIYPEAGGTNGLIYTALGLNGEAGEVAEEIKKMIRDDDSVLSEERRKRLKGELGDVLWYLSAMCQEAGFTLEEVAQNNIDKLFDRQERGVLNGFGDNR